MSLLFSILYAAHANGTHHKLALDALRFLPRDDREAWERVFLKHVKLYLEGSKAPDKEFKDFKNHVLHVRDNYWGGAPERVEAWYGRTVEALARGDWAEAVYAAGILSHYATDPIHPFHTAQSEAENNIHRAVEWSISKTYGELWQEGARRRAGMVITVPEGSQWLKELVCRGAELANRSYETLIAHYDFTRGVVDPASGLDQTGREAAGSLLVYAAQSFAEVLSRAISQSDARPPEVTLAAETVLATLEMPAKWVTKRIEDAAVRREVEAMYDELKTFGRVETTLSEDDRMVRDLHAREVVAPRASRRKEERDQRIQAAPPSTVSALPISRAAPAARPAASAGDQAGTGLSATVVVRPLERAVREVQVRPYLASGDDIEAAPSIGPKMAERLKAARLSTVADLLAAEPEAVALSLGDRRISPATVRDWQDQARLMIVVPGLRGGAAQLLVGAGYRDVAALAAADAATLSAALLRFAATGEGERILRTGEPPDLEKIRGWIARAGEARAA